jgi:hypothetical protein
LKRRNFVLGLAGLGGIGALAGWDIARVTPEDAVVMVLRKRLNYLTLDEAGVWQFARDCVTRMPVSSAKLRIIAAIAPIYSRLPTSPDTYAGSLTRFGEERIVTRYLLSSDFFVGGADEQRVVHYLAYFDALRACSNPFARPVLAQDQTIGST